MDIITIVCACVFVLTVWFETEAFVEYGKLLGLDKLLRIDKFKDAQSKDLTLMNYRMFLATEHNNFITRLLNCVFCLGFWVVLVVCPLFSYYNVPLIYVSTMLVILLQRVLIKYS